MKARSLEKNKLVEFLNDNSTNVALATGRSGMGKSQLLKNLVKEYQGVYFAAYPTTDIMELKLLSNAIYGTTETNEEDYKDIATLCEKVKELADPSKPYLFIVDNYPEFVKASNSYDKEFADAVRDIFGGTNVKVILCSDSFINMHKICLDRVSPWQKLNPVEIKFDKLSFLETIDYIDEGNDGDSVFLYGITGGMPSLLDKFANEKVDRNEAVRRCFLERVDDANPETAMKNDLREPAYYNRMMQVLSSGVQRVNEISEIVGKPKDIVVPYLKTLINLSLVKKETPITEKNNRRKTRYSLVNSADKFWYKYIVPALPVIETTGEEFVLPDTEDFERSVFIDICKEYLMTKSQGDDLPFTLEEVGNWWENNDEEHTTVGFDAVGLGKNGDEDASVFCRCYYSDKQIEIQDLKALIELTKKVRRRGDNFYMIFSAAGFSEHALTVGSAIKNIILVDLNTIIKEARAN